MSVLQPASVALLRTVRPCAPLFSNMILAEIFEAKHKVGELEVLPRTTGSYVVFDQRAPNNKGVLGEFQTEDEAHAALVRIAGSRK